MNKTDPHQALSSVSKRHRPSSTRSSTRKCRILLFLFHVTDHNGCLSGTTKITVEEYTFKSLTAAGAPSFAPYVNTSKLYQTTPRRATPSEAYSQNHAQHAELSSRNASCVSQSSKNWQYTLRRVPAIHSLSTRASEIPSNFREYFMYRINANSKCIQTRKR